MIAFTIRAIRRGGWRDPALFALVVVAVGGINATALVSWESRPLLWFPFAVWVTKEAPLRRAAGAFGAHRGPHRPHVAVVDRRPVAPGQLRHRHPRSTRRPRRSSASAAVAPRSCAASATGSSTAATGSGPWIEPSVNVHATAVAVIAVTYLLPILALLGGAISRWTHRAYFVDARCSPACSSPSAPIRGTTRR